MKRAKRYILLSGIVFSLFALSVSGQIPNTMFFMPGVPQSNRINPAIQPGCGFYLGMPALAPFRFELLSSSLAANDVVFPSPNDPLLGITAFHPLADKEEFLNKLKDKNTFLTNTGVSLASIGKKVGRNFFSFDVSTRVEATLTYPKGLFELPIYGLEDGGDISLEGLGLDASSFLEFGLGWSRSDFLLRNFNVGVRGKALFGLANLSTRSSVMNITSGVNEGFGIHSDMEFAVSTVPLLIDFNTYELDLDNITMPIWGWEGVDWTDINAIKKKLFARQNGLAFDLGVDYRPIPQLRLSASMLDIGFIKWTNSAITSFNYDYEFPGLEYNPFEEMDGQFMSELATNLIDSIKNAVVLNQGGSYVARLNSKLFIGAAYYPIEKIGFGLMSRTDFLSQSVSQQFTGTVNMTTGKLINLSLSYSYMQRRFNNVGAGLSLNLGPLNMYVISDNIISAGLLPLNARSANLWFGMNISFGWKRIKAASSREKSSRGTYPTGDKARKVDMPLIL